MTAEISIKPEVIRWAYNRVHIPGAIPAKYKKWLEAGGGAVRMTDQQMRDFARFVGVSPATLHRPSPPKEDTLARDFRTMGGKGVLSRPSVNLSATMDICQRRQRWYRDYCVVNEKPLVPFVGAANIDTMPTEVAQQMRHALAFTLDEQMQCSAWDHALTMFVEKTEAAGVLVMVNGWVGNDTSRKLNVKEFRGFALVDDYAPLIFINGQDSKAAQMFTLAHELAHIWLGASKLDGGDAMPHTNKVEKWCDQVAAEFLVPSMVLSAQLPSDKLSNDKQLENELSRLTRTFKVSRYVILRRLLDMGFLSQTRFRQLLAKPKNWLNKQASKKRNPASRGGSPFHKAVIHRVSRQFAQAVVADNRQRYTSFTDAFRLFDIPSLDEFQAIQRELGAEVNA